ncbi:MAG TPA: flavodoxin-dependent (E)-4-hydroxy-3-methylbut-2-enyl-diphosphate synthase [Pseudothermotoga sp.]|uniref:flavodoxin-dependent (E)-4-hydroxy-3-methylbut-2-enyl-diphosphate synthase n=1 Tax=Thermotoga profunda TaxID=1508420 RepID=UPI000596E35A|nr:flavodoxin-dependent (E)-4-hydroxy-3-methylbut-2-enyl-diphosphate synthase [Thermotoga profunda]
MSKVVKVGKVLVGGGNPVTIQSMTNTKTVDIEQTVQQIKMLQDAGCDIVRVAVPDFESARAIKLIKEQINIPLVADIHFDHRLAIEAIKNGADKIRINPGNIGEDWKIEELSKVAKEFQIPIRVGSNVGSLRKEFESKYDRATALAESALHEVYLLEKFEFYDIVVSVKSSDVIETIKANEYIAQKIIYPIHIGITEAGTYDTSIIKSSVGIGHLLLRKIGDTIRVSIAGDPIKEVYAARKLLVSLHLRKGGQVIACPTCARTEFDVEQVARSIEPIVEGTNLVVAVMGCVVNGIGEGRHADIGIAGTKDGAVIFEKGQIIKTVKRESICEELLNLIKKSHL